ncbi:MAG: NrsF family protein [Pseudooceanicola sp.]
MKTDDLITMLAQDAAPPPAASIERRAGLGLVLGLGVAIALFFATLGPRPLLAEVMRDPVILAKTLLPLALAALALPLGLRAVRPARPLGRTGRVIWAVPAVAAALFVWAYLATPPEWRMTLFIGHSIPVCLPAITILSLPILAGLLAGLRRGAPLSPGRAGALAGLAAAGLATTVYSTFCTEDSPLFYAVWYSLAIGIATGIGALAGRRFLRW